MEDIIVFKNVSKTYGENVIIFDDVNFRMKQNQIVGLIGENGSGKTTFINLIGGLLKPDNGEVVVLDKKLSSEKNTVLIKEKISILGDANRALYWNLTGRDNIEYFWCLKTGNSLRNIPEKCLNLINGFNMKSFIDKKVESYSKGMKQKLLLVIALLNSPKILFMDEPLNGLDFENALIFKELLKHYVKVEKGTILMTSHDANFMNEMCDIRYEISNKKVNILSDNVNSKKLVKFYFQVKSDLIKWEYNPSKKIYNVSENIKYIESDINDYENLRFISQAIENDIIEIIDFVR